MKYKYEQTKEFLITEIEGDLTIRQQKLFLLMATERKFMVYKQYAKGQEWDHTEKLNAMLEDCWDMAVNGTRHEYIMDRVRELTEEEYNSDDDYKGPDRFLYECWDDTPSYLIQNYKEVNWIEVLSRVVQHIHDMLSQIALLSAHEMNDDDNIIISTCNFLFLEDFLCEYSPELIDKVYDQNEEELFEEHELVLLEFERQKRDIEYLKTEKDLQKIYQRYHFDLQESILEGYWFDENIPYTYDEQEKENKEKIINQEIDSEILEALHENAADSYYTHGCIYTDAGRYEEAAQLFTEVIDLQADNVDAYSGRAFDYMRLEEYEKAITDYNKVIALNPNHKHAYFNLGYIYAQLQQHEKAITYYEKVIALNPNEEKIYLNLGKNYNKLKDYKTAIFYFGKMIALNPNFAEAYFCRANSYSALEEHQKSVDDLTKAIMLKPDYADAYYNRADSYAELKEYEKAIADLTKAIALNPDFTEAYCNRGAIYNILEEYEKAIADFDKAEKLNPTIVQIYYNRGESYHLLGEYQKAISDFSKVIAHDPNDKEAYLNRAKAYRAIGETEKAIADENTAKKLQ